MDMKKQKAGVSMHKSSGNRFDAHIKIDPLTWSVARHQ